MNSYATPRSTGWATTADELPALLDANVLYPAPMRDVLMQLAVADLFKAKWTADIDREWIEALMRNEPWRDEPR